MLSDLLYTVKTKSVTGSTAVSVPSLHTDSRTVKSGGCFIAVKGTATDGHTYIAKAIELGATSVVAEQMPATKAEGVTYVEVADSAAAAGIMAHNFYESPSSCFHLVGVTGTNGKTTVTTLLFQLFSALGFKCGLVSTVENRIGDKIIPSTHTTPDPISLNALLKEMCDEYCTYVFMECSSHAIAQQRMAGLIFKGALFTNITHDHLDYHNTFDEYIRVKKSWFDQLPSSAFAISNLDDKRGTVMLQNTAAKKYYYSLRTVTDFKGKILDNSLQGLHLSINDTDVHFKLIGEFNAYNLTAVYGAAICLKQKKEDVLLALSNLNGAAGRFEYTMSAAEEVMGIVDYAHTPDALLNVLQTIKNLRRGNEKVLTVIGCGGNRDKTKRPVMAKVACEYSDRVILTSDNPRNEEPEEILADMQGGVDAAQKKKLITIADRREAIKTAVSLCGNNDILLVAGKGHENYQEIKGVKHQFDDKEVLKEMFELLGK